MKRNIQISFETLKNLVDEEQDFTHDGEEYIFHCDNGEDMDDNGRSNSYIYRRKNDGRFFEITVNRARYGYEDYSLEDFVNDCELIEVKEETVTKTIWVGVN